MRIGRILAMAMVVALALGTFAVAGDTCLKCKVKGFVKAHIDRDVDRALSYMTDDVAYHRADTGLDLDRDGLAAMLRWEFATGTSRMYESLEWEGDTVKAVFKESNDFYPLIGMKGRKYAMTFRFENDRIAEWKVEPVKCGCPRLEEKLASFLQWAEANRAEELNAVYSDGVFRYEGEAGETWMSLVKAWRDRT